MILALDVGTSSARAVIFDPALRAVDAFSAPVLLNAESEIDPAVLMETVAGTIDRALAAAPAPLRAVGMTTLATTMMGVDAAERPVTPMLTYADTRSGPDVRALRASLDESAVHDRTGCRLHSSYWPARFVWMKRERPAWRAARWIGAGEFLLGTFLGHRAVTRSIASWTGLLDRRTREWDAPWLEKLGVGVTALSPLTDADVPAAGLRAAWAARWPALREVPWFPPVSDGAAANLGTGCDTPRRVALTVGTSGAMRAVVGDPDRVPEGLWCYRVDRRRALLGGATTEGGNVFAWMRRTLSLPPDIEGELARMEPTDLTLLPHLAGERAPGWRDEARGAVAGLSLSTRPIDILRAALEAVALRFALIHQRMAPHLPADHGLIAGGGALLASPAWLQIFADVLGRPVTASAEPEATARGAALLAAGEPPSPARDGRLYPPDARRHARYGAALERQIALYDALGGPGVEPSMSIGSSKAIR